MPTRRQLLLSAVAMGVIGAGTLPACSRGPSPETEEGDPLRMRVWDDAAASAYETSLAAFTEQSGVGVEVEVMGWDDYWAQLPLDIAGETLPDVLWMNTAQLADALASGSLLEVEGLLGGAVAQWEQAPTELYRTADGLWGVPQLWDQSILVAHQDLVAAAGVDPAALRFEPGAPADPLRDAARALTVDAEGRHPGDEGFDPASRSVHGFSAHPDRTGVLGPFVAGQGGAWQDEEGTFTFASEQGIAAVQYLADLAAAHLGPDGAATTEDARLCRDLFTQGKMGLLQTGTYDLHALVDEVGGSFGWSVHPPVAGPQGSRPLLHAIAAVGVDPDDEDRAAAIGELLAWLGGVEGQRPLAENRLGLPAHRDLRGVWEEGWAADGVDLAAIAETPRDIALPETGARSAAGTGAALPIIAEVFRGETPAAEALPRAQQAAREAMG